MTVRLLSRHGPVAASRPQAFTDSFTRADSATTLGTPWTALSGTWGISSNQAYAPSAGIATVDAGSANVSVSAKIGVRDSGTGILARVQDANNFYMLLVANDSNAYIYKRVAGSWTQLTAATPNAANDVWRFDLNGSRLTAYRNGTRVLAVTDTTFASGSTVGLRADGSSARWDDFSAGPYSAPSEATIHSLIMAASPYLYWPLDDGVGANSAVIIDDSGNNRDGTLVTGSTMTGAPSPFTNAFKPNNSRISRPSVSGAFDTMTIHACVCRTATVSASPAAIATLGNGRPYLRWGTGTGSQILRSQVANLASPGYTFPLDTWVDVIWTRSGTGTDKVFINGSDQLISAAAATMASSTRNFTVGAEENAFGSFEEYGTDDYFVAHAALWDRALSDSEAAAIGAVLA